MPDPTVYEPPVLGSEYATRRSQQRGYSGGYAPHGHAAPQEGRSDDLSPSLSDLSRSTSDMRNEVAELRSLVQELLNRPMAPAASGPSEGVQQSPPAGVPEELHDYYVKLIQNEVAEELAREVVIQAKEKLSDWQTRQEKRAKQGRKRGPDGRFRPVKNDPNGYKRFIPEAMLDCVAKLLPEADPVELPADGKTKYVALIGPTGVGKTTTIAKLAAHFKLRENKNVALVTTDTYRIAAVDQLKAYAEILDIPLEVVMTPVDMREVIHRLSDRDVVLIDTSGRSQKDTGRLSDLKAFLAAGREASQSADESSTKYFETHLVLSCTANPAQMLSVGETFSALGVDRVVFTKLDESIGAGVVLNVARKLGLQLSYLTTGQDVPDDIEVGHRRRIAEMILKGDRGNAPDGAEAPAGQARAKARVDHTA